MNTVPLRNQLLEQAKRDRDYIRRLPLVERKLLALQWADLQRIIREGAQCDAIARTSSQ